MTDVEKAKMRKSIEEAKDAIAKGLLLPEDASQLWRMIDYYEDKMKREEK